MDGAVRMEWTVGNLRAERYFGAVWNIWTVWLERMVGLVWTGSHSEFNRKPRCRVSDRWHWLDGIG